MDNCNLITVPFSSDVVKVTYVYWKKYSGVEVFSLLLLLLLALGPECRPGLWGGLIHESFFTEE